MIRHVPPFPPTPQPGDRYPWGDTEAIVFAIVKRPYEWIVRFTVGGQMCQEDRKRFLREVKT